MLGTPLLQTSSVHWLPSTGTSEPSMTLVMFPAPSHTRRWQSPGVCEPVFVPAGALEEPQVYAEQVR